MKCLRLGAKEGVKNKNLFAIEGMSHFHENNALLQISISLLAFISLTCHSITLTNVTVCVGNERANKLRIEATQTETCPNYTDEQRSN